MTTRTAWPFTVLSSIVIVLTSLLASGCGGDDGGTPTPESAAFTSPLTLSLAWDPVQDPGVTGYVIHYGTSSPNSSGSCSYEHAVFVSAPEGTVVNLHPESQYYFAVSSYNGVESSCSSEVSTITPPLPV